MGKYAKYEKRYKKEWENIPVFKGWLKPGILDPDKAHCVICKIDLRAHKTDLIRHSKTTTHVRKTTKVVGIGNDKNKKLLELGVTTSSSITKDIKTMDLKLAAYIAIHSSINSIDHLGELLKVIGVGKKL